MAGLTRSIASKYCPDTDYTIKGHLAQTQQHIRPSSCPTPQPAPGPTPPTPAQELHLLELPLGKLFTDDTGPFPVRSRSGNQYIMVAYHYDGNAILVQPFQSKHDTHRIPAYNTIMTRLKARGLTVNKQILDNEASVEYRRTITDKWHCTYQLVPPDMHRRNRAERAIRTFKAHFLAILAGVDPAFPASRWDLLLPHTELTLNLLRQSRLHPTISAAEGLYGKFNFDATPMGPPGSRVIYHAKPGTRCSWDF